MSFLNIGKMVESRQCSWNSAAISPMDDDDEDDEYFTPDEYFTSENEEKEDASVGRTKGIDRKSSVEHASSNIRVPAFTEPCKLERKSSGKDLKRQKSGSLVTSVPELFKGFRPGSDLTKFPLPPQFNLPKSQLQVYGEAVYCCSQYLLGMCTDGVTPVDRFLSVLRFHLSTTRPAPFAKAPYNPILGETHHVSVGDLNVLCEQVSHHPPITALYATDEVKKVQMLWWHQPVPRFYGGSVEATILGQRQLKLIEHDETYEMTSPNLLIRIFPTASNEWVGTTTVHCKESDLEATVIFKSKTFFGMRGSCNKVSGKVIRTSTEKLIYELSGSWDGVVTLKDKVKATTTTLYDAQSAIADIHAPEVENLEELSPLESVIVWSDLTKSIVNNEWANARDAKRQVEEAQRALQKKRVTTNAAWSSKYFKATEDGNWVWQRQGHPVPHAPIVVK